MISPSQRPLPDNTQHSQQTNIQALGGIRTHDRSRRATVDLRLRPRGRWDRLIVMVLLLIIADYSDVFIGRNNRRLQHFCVIAEFLAVEQMNVADVQRIQRE